MALIEANSLFSDLHTECPVAESGIGYYISGGPTVTHTETTDEFGDVEFIGYVGGSYDKFYGELSAVTNEDLVDWGAKAGVKFTF